MDFRGRVALVTGGGTGIGRAVAESLGRAGARAVVINYSRSQEEAEATATALGEMGVEGVPWRADVADERDVRDMVSGVVERLERLDVLVNNAGTTHFIPQRDLEALTDQVWDVRSTVQPLRVGIWAPLKAPFGALFTAAVDGQVYAQPLVSSGTLVVATEKNNVYGLAAGTGYYSGALMTTLVAVFLLWPMRIVARRLFDLGATKVTVYSNVVTVEAPAPAWGDLEPKVTHTIEHLFEFYGDDAGWSFEARGVEATASKVE